MVLSESEALDCLIVDKTTRPTLIGIGVQHGLYTYKPQAGAICCLSPNYQ
ncbi:MAG: hypothetical protein J6J26_10670 [Bacteroides sp.]|nr:hypothetical protein [Bacteroides sp.]